jgi:hypothetical protein
MLIRKDRRAIHGSGRSLRWSFRPRSKTKVIQRRANRRWQISRRDGWRKRHRKEPQYEVLRLSVPPSSREIAAGATPGRRLIELTPKQGFRFLGRNNSSCCTEFVQGQAIVMIAQRCRPRRQWGRWGRGRDRGRAPVGFESGPSITFFSCRRHYALVYRSSGTICPTISPRWALRWINAPVPFGSKY